MFVCKVNHSLPIHYHSLQKNRHDNCMRQANKKGPEVASRPFDIR
jgi:hypothetical protein